MEVNIFLALTTYLAMNFAGAIAYRTIGIDPVIMLRGLSSLSLLLSVGNYLVLIAVHVLEGRMPEALIENERALATIYEITPGFIFGSVVAWLGEEIYAPIKRLL